VSIRLTGTSDIQPERNGRKVILKTFAYLGAGIILEQSKLPMHHEDGKLHGRNNPKGGNVPQEFEDQDRPAAYHLATNPAPIPLGLFPASAERLIELYQALIFAAPRLGQS